MSEDRFPQTSRYYGIETAQTELRGGRRVVYLRRRFVPDPSRFATLMEHQVVQGDRIDRLAAQVFGDPEQFFRIADANADLLPSEMEETGRRLRITLPEGMAGAADA